MARTWSADLILVGSRGLKGLKEMFLGSVGNYVTHHAPCSALIVRTDTDAVSCSMDLSYEEAEEAESAIAFLGFVSAIAMFFMDR